MNIHWRLWTRRNDRNSGGMCFYILPVVLYAKYRVDFARGYAILKKIKVMINFCTGMRL